MIGIIPLLNYLNVTFCKKVCDIFPVILSTPHRESEFLRLMDPMFDFIIRETLKNYSTNEAIDRIATKTLDSFIELLKYGFEDPSYMSYDVLYKKTNLILRSFFDFLKEQNMEYNRMWGSSVVLTDEMAIKYHSRSAVISRRNRSRTPEHFYMMVRSEPRSLSQTKTGRSMLSTVAVCVQ